jgi:azurin
MKNPFALAAIAALLLAGCGKQTTTTVSSEAPAGPREIDITAGDNMKYSLTQIDAHPGEDLRVVLTNAGSAPLEVMGHNWVLLKAGSDVAAFDTAAAQSKDTGYIPGSLQDEIIAHIDLLGPRKSGEADFKAPDAPGDYAFLCTFPAHFQNGMHGTLTVH